MDKGGFLFDPYPRHKAEGPFRSQSLLCGSVWEMQVKKRVVSLSTQTDNIVEGLWLVGDYPLGKQSRQCLLWGKYKRSSPLEIMHGRAFCISGQFSVSFLNLIAIKLQWTKTGKLGVFFQSVRMPELLAATYVNNSISTLEVPCSWRYFSKRKP